MVKKVYTTFQLLRYPLVFGSVLLAYFTAFSYSAMGMTKIRDRLRIATANALVY